LRAGFTAQDAAHSERGPFFGSDFSTRSNTEEAAELRSLRTRS